MFEAMEMAMIAMKLQALWTIFVYLAMSHMQWKIICRNGGEGRQCDMIHQQRDGWLTRTTSYNVIHFCMFQGYTPLGTRLFHSAIKCLHYVSSKLSASSLLLTYVCMRFFHSKAESLLSPYIELQNRNGSTPKEYGLTLFGTLWQFW